MHNTKKISSCLMIIAMTTSLLYGCGKSADNVNVNIIGDVSESSTTSATSTTVSLPEYDSSNVASSIEAQNTTKTSYYTTQLDNRLTVSLSEIKTSIANAQTEAVLSKYISADELDRLMNILYIDYPEYAYLNPSYSYTLNSENYVEKVYLQYNASTANISNMNKSISDTTNKSYIFNTDNKTTEYDIETNIINAIMGKKYKVAATATIGDGTVNDKNSQSIDSASNILSFFYKTPANSLGTSKSIVYLLRQNGIDATTVLGDLTNYDISPDTLVTSNDYKNVVTTSSGGQTVFNVSKDFSKYWAWVVVKLGDDWYNLDCTYETLEDNKLDDSNVSFDCQGLENVPDETISASRVFYKNEELLGISPSCTSSDFQYYYRKGNYLLTHTSEQMTSRINKIIQDMAGNYTKTKIIQFKDENTYNLFVNNFSSMLSDYNNANNNEIYSYNISEIRAELTVYLYNFKYK